MLATWGRTDPGARLARACADGCDGATWAGPSRRSPWWPSSSPGRGWTAARWRCPAALRCRSRPRRRASRRRRTEPLPARRAGARRARPAARAPVTQRELRAPSPAVRRARRPRRERRRRARPRRGSGAPAPAATPRPVAPAPPPAIAPAPSPAPPPAAHGGPRRARVRLRAVARRTTSTQHAVAQRRLVLRCGRPTTSTQQPRAAPRGVAASRALSPPPRPPAPSCGCPRSARRSSRPDRAT